MQNITPENMMALQTNNHDIFAEEALPIFLKNMQEDGLVNNAKKYLGILKGWNLSNGVKSKGPTVFNLLWQSI